jgi:lysozyme family protein
MSRRHLSRTGAALATGVVTAGLLTGLTTTASAASYPTCNGSKSFAYGSGSYTHPYYKSSGSTNCILAYGSQSDAVKTLQSSLRTCYKYTSVETDGIFGDKTLAALKKVQDLEDVDIDGVYGPDTRKAMLWFVFNEDVSVAGCKYVNR